MSKTYWFVEPLSVLSLQWKQPEEKKSRVNTQFINIAEDKRFHKKNTLVSSRFEKSSGGARFHYGNTEFSEKPLFKFVQRRGEK